LAALPNYFGGKVAWFDTPQSKVCAKKCKIQGCHPPQLRALPENVLGRSPIGSAQQKPGMPRSENKENPNTIPAKVRTVFALLAGTSATSDGVVWQAVRRTPLSFL